MAQMEGLHSFVEALPQDQISQEYSVNIIVKVSKYAIEQGFWTLTEESIQCINSYAIQNMDT